MNIISNIISNINGKNIIPDNEKIVVVGNIIDSINLNNNDDFFIRCYNIRNIIKCIKNDNVSIIFGSHDISLINLINLKLGIGLYNNEINYIEIIKKYNIQEQLPFTIMYEYSLLNNLGLENEIYELYKNRLDEKNYDKINHLYYLFIDVINKMFDEELYMFYLKGDFYDEIVENKIVENKIVENKIVENKIKIYLSENKINEKILDYQYVQKYYSKLFEEYDLLGLLGGGKKEGGESENEESENEESDKKKKKSKRQKYGLLS